MIDGFDWDDGNLSKCQKHGVTIAEIEALFAGPLTVFQDPHQNEERLRGIGKTKAGRHVFIVWTVRRSGAEMHIRPISARYMHQKEVRYYESL